MRADSANVPWVRASTCSERRFVGGCVTGDRLAGKQTAAVPLDWRVNQRGRLVRSGWTRRSGGLRRRRCAGSGFAAVLRSDSPGRTKGAGAAFRARWLLAFREARIRGLHGRSCSSDATAGAACSSGSRNVSAEASVSTGSATGRRPHGLRGGGGVHASACRLVHAVFLAGFCFPGFGSSWGLSRRGF